MCCSIQRTRPCWHFKGIALLINLNPNTRTNVFQPSKDALQLLPLSGENILVDVDNDEMQISEDGIKLNNDAHVREVRKLSKDLYPSIFTKFKIDSKLEEKQNERNSRSVLKPIIKSSDAKISDTNSKNVEQQIYKILDDMGLLENEKNKIGETEKSEAKRGVLSEDENLEEGTNKINLIKDETRQKRNEISTQSSLVTNSAQFSEKEAFQTKSVQKRECSRSNLKQVTESNIAENSKLVEYEHEVENNIRQKIQSLKEEVKREIEELQKNQKQQMKEIKKDDGLRKKRNAVNTLLDEETDNINPAINLDETPRPLIRRRRDVNVHQSRKLNSDDDYYVNDDDASNLHEPEHSHGDDCNNESCSSQNNCKCDNQDCKNCQKTKRINRSAKEQNFIPAVEENNYETDDEAKDNVKREAIEENYYVDLNPDVYQMAPEVNMKDLARGKRDTINSKLEDSAVRNHLSALSHRSMLNNLPNARDRRRIFHIPQSQPQQLTDMTDEELFGALLQHFEGDLARYKRIKRSKS